MSGTISLSLTQQFDNTTGELLSGGFVYFIQAGTTAAPQNAYRDSGLSSAYANPYELDTDGRIPQLFFADGNIKIRITNADGVTQFSQDNILVISPSAGDGAGATVDETTILATGDIKLVYNTGTLSGFVRCNGRTIGDASSGGTERANADTSDLFSFLWSADSNLSVSGGRGANAAADFAAHKTIALPDLRGRVPGGLDDMGASAAGRLTATYFGTAATALGAVSTPTESKTLLTANLPAYTPAGTVTAPSIVYQPVRNDSADVGAYVASASGSGQTNTGVSTPVFTGTPQGGTSTPFAIVQPTMLITFYIKL